MRKAFAIIAVVAISVGLGTAHAQEPDTFAGLKARSIGPAGMSGRVAAVDVVESDPNIIYVGAATGGVWKSTDGGTTWQPIFDDQPVHAIGAVAVDQSNPAVVWVGTGEANVRNSVSIGNGVYKSIDGGRTWQHLGLDKSERIHRIALHPARPEVAYVCATGPEWGEHKDRGVFKTEDAGTTWRHVLAVNEKTGCGDMAMDPSNPDKLFASMWEFRRWPWFFNSGGHGSGLYVTHDGGGTWRKLQEEDGLPKAPHGRIGIAIARSQPSTVYAMVEAAKSAVIRSDDGGRKWRTVNDKPNVNPRPFYYADITVDPQRPDLLYSIDYEIRASEDGGETFTTLPGATWAQIHGDHHALWIHPERPEFMISGNDGGVAISYNRGQTFRFVGNLPLAQYYHVAVDHETPYNIYGGMQDNGSWRGPSNVWRRGGIRNYDWQEVGGGDGFETLPHPADATVGYALWQGGNIMRWNLRTGEQKLLKPADPKDVKLRFNWNAGLATDPFEPDAVYLGSQFVHKSTDRAETWTTISPDLTTNNSEWQRAHESGGLTPDVTAAENHTTIVAIAPSPKERGVIWIGTDDGRVHVTRDGGGSWTSVEKNVAGVPANTWVPHIEPSPHDAATAFVVFDNHRRSDFAPYIYRTDDFGKTWRSIGGANLHGYALVVRQDPVERNLLFLGTEFGLYFSPDAGKRWIHLKKTLPTASVMDMVIHPREHDLVIGTHGRAAWVLDDIRPLRAMSEQALKAPLTLYPIGDTHQYWSRGEEGGFGFGASEFRGAARLYGAILTYSLNLPDLPLPDEEQERARREKERQARVAQEQAKPARPEKSETPRVSESVEPQRGQRRGEAAEADKDDEKPQVDITVEDASGRVVRRFKAPAVRGVNRVAWNLKRDGFRQAPRAEDAPPLTEEPTGPEVPPGTYKVTMKYQTHESSQTVRVGPDPRSKNTDQAWQQREQAIVRLGALNDAAVDAIWRVRRTRSDITALQDRLRQRARDAGERDQEKIDAHPIIKAGTPLVERLNAFEKRLWASPETVGIVADTDVYSRVSWGGWYLGSSMDPPNANQLEHLRQGEAALSAFLEEFNAFLGSDLAAFQKQAAEFAVVGDTTPISIKP